MHHLLQSAREQLLRRIHLAVPCTIVDREKLNVQPTSAHLACRGPSAAQPLAVVLPTLVTVSNAQCCVLSCLTYRGMHAGS